MFRPQFATFFVVVVVGENVECECEKVCVCLDAYVVGCRYAFVHSFIVIASCFAPAAVRSSETQQVIFLYSSLRAQLSRIELYSYRYPAASP